MKISLLGEISAVDDDAVWNQGLLRRFNLDTPLLLGLLTISILGLVILYSAGRQNPDLLIRQGIRLALGFGVMVLLAQIHPQQMRNWTPWVLPVVCCCWWWCC